jgi:hypothetical protein
MWLVQGMFMLCLSRDLELGGKPCQGIGAKIGRATHISTAKASPSESQQVMARLLPATILCLRIGNLDKLSKEANSSKVKCPPRLVFQAEKTCSYMCGRLCWGTQRHQGFQVPVCILINSQNCKKEKEKWKKVWYGIRRPVLITFTLDIYTLRLKVIGTQPKLII